METAAVVSNNLLITRNRKRILQRVSFKIEPGQIVGLVGPSGSGKTTLMRVVVGLQKVTDGGMNVLGLSAGSAPLRDRIGYMAQSPSVYDDLTVWQNSIFFARILGYPRVEAERVLKVVDLTAQRHQRVETLSGGQRTRVSLAIALLGRPALLVLDEPTVGLDPVLRESLWTIFRELSDGGVTLIVSSHVMEEASRCDQLLLLRDGRLIANESVQDLLLQTGADDVESAFLQLVTKRKDRHE